MPVTIRSADLSRMTPLERSEAMTAALEAPQELGRAYAVALDAKIRAYEARYELPTSALPAALASSQIRETAEVCDWLFWADVRERIGQARPE